MDKDKVKANLTKIINQLNSTNIGLKKTLSIEARTARGELGNLIEVIFGNHHRLMNEWEKAAQLSGPPNFIIQLYIDNHIALANIVLNAVELLDNLESYSLPSSDENIEGKSVFVVHGRNKVVRKSMFNLLRAFGLQPIEWSEARIMTGNPSPYIGEILDIAFSRAQAVVVIFTGDDLAYLKDKYISSDDPYYEKEPTPQARPNVLFEAGMALARHPKRTVLAQVGTIRPISDIAGRHIIKIDNSVASRQELALRLRDSGCKINIEGTDWHTIGDFKD